MSLIAFPMSLVGLPVADQNGGATLTAATVDLNASSDQIEILFTIIADGTCTGVDWLQGSASVGVNLTVRLETINLTTGRASGTLYHANATATAGSGSGWVSTAWSSFTVNRGDKVALVIKPTSGTPTAQRISCFNDGGSTVGPEWPRVIEADGTPADVACAPIVALNYNGSHYYTPGLYGMSGVTPYSFNTGSANDTYGAKFRFPTGVRLSAVRIWVDSDGDFEVVLLNSSKTLLTSAQWDKDLPGGFISASSLITIPFDDEVELAANTDYYVLIRATTATSITLETQDVSTAAHRVIAHPLGTGICTAYCDYGAGPWSGVTFTEVTTQIPFIDFFINGIATDPPAESDVRLGVDYDFGTMTGTLDLPAESDVEDGVTYDNLTKTGTFEAPSVNDVRDGVTYGNAGEFEGNCAVPVASNVRNGTPVGSGTGTLVVPAAGDVRSGVNYDTTTGTLDLPSINDVQDGVSFDGATKTGVLELPAEAFVADGVGYGANGTEFTGTASGGDYPAEIDVRSGVSYAEGGLTGTLAVPALGDVRDGVPVDASTGLLVIPAEGDVRDGTGYGSEATEFEGTLNLPAESDVESGVSYDGGAKTGSFAVPAQGDVQSGVSYGHASEYTGTFAAPAVGDVRDGTTYGNAGEFTGTCAVPSAANVRAGTAVDATTGTLAVPTAANVRSGVAVDAGTGTCAVPSAANVRAGTAVDATTGTLDLPAVGDVQAGVQFDGNTKTGTFAVPAESQVENGVGYGAGGIEFTGTLTGEAPDYPDPADVRSGVSFDGGDLTGTCAVPTAANVRSGVAVDASTGTLDLPAVGDVQAGIQFDGATKTGTLVLPDDGDVRLGEGYGAGGTEFVGKCRVPGASRVELGFEYDDEDSVTGTLDVGGGGGGDASDWREGSREGSRVAD